MPTETASAKYSFGTGGRTKAAWNGKEIWARYGKWGPGPKYKLQENIKLDNPPKFSIGHSPRNSADTPRYYSTSYEYFDEHESNYPIDVSDAKKKVMPKHSFMQLGTETRMFSTLKSITPGAKYNPTPQFESPKVYTMEAKRRPRGSSDLDLLTGTTNRVGPSSYRAEKLKTSAHRKVTSCAFGRQRRDQRWDANTTAETYDKQTAFGN